MSAISPISATEKETNDELARIALITAKDGKNKALEEAITKYHRFIGGKKGS